MRVDRLRLHTAIDQEQIVSENRNDPPVNSTQPTVTAAPSTGRAILPFQHPSRFAVATTKA